ncbi:DUF433 domain-containing protein [Hymenobacter sp. 5516J-16]|uniref:DUF433 domain-containing protein n=1 Tax=Hymenobacter sublimis TaxID=2933777 RepID=A0ABY4J6U5_9BACT|nr:MULTISPECIES: DUF433 domain-containing protein [Hymenobacter]UOQ78565.1 DUF433 domain-containing protein [Hymenobacter sp. 5516J-16]UPL48548.1 DUF433 domain-containing protein [Hymenobacter sublimis]
MKTAHPLISTQPGVRFGKPCLVGTRIAVQDVLGWLASGMSFEEIVEDFPELTLEHIRAALAFAAAIEQRTRQVAA